MCKTAAKVNITGRFAPTPSGKMHAGNLMCALLAYLSAKSKGGKFIVRIEDLDSARCPRNLADEILSTLAVFGLYSDEQPVYQSERSEVYRKWEQIIAQKVRVYPCFCSRAMLRVAEAPRAMNGEPVYSGRCAKLTKEQAAALAKTKKPCYRIQAPDEYVEFTDGLCGKFGQNLKSECGDFIIRRSDGVYAYQLAVAADDTECGVTEVVRGDDLISSTPRQIWLMSLVDSPPPTYYHIPLVCSNSGRKLSKSDGDDSVQELLKALSPQQILGRLAFAAGLTPTNEPRTLKELINVFDWKKVKKDKIYLPEEMSGVSN